MDKHLPKICFLADSHDLFDDRIYWKEACSLVKAGYEVHYVLAADKIEQGVTHEGIHFNKVKKDLSSNRYFNYLLKRFSRKGLYPQLLKAARATKADVFHLHDLKLLQLIDGLKKFPNKPKIVYDIHEPYPENILDYDHGGNMNKLLKRRYSKMVRKWEKQKAGLCDLIITTEENLQERFKTYYPDKRVEIIYNYTNLNIQKKLSPPEEREFDAIYTGGITKLRGAINILKATVVVIKKIPGFKILFLGSWFPPELKTEMLNFVLNHQLQKNVVFKDAVPYNKVVEFYMKSKIGLGIFLPIPTHDIILQIKIFEYMRFGLPILGSNFGHIQCIIQKHQCGVMVDPESPVEIADAIIKLLSDNDFYNQCAADGQKAAEQFYRWEIMEKKLIDLYKQLIS